MNVTLSGATLETLERVARDADVAPRYDYVGRGMGRTCLAVVGDASGLTRFLLGLAEEVAGAVPDVAEELGELVDAMRESRTSYDSMGHDTVYYWPGVRLERAP